MQQELDAVDVLKHPGTLRVRTVAGPTLRPGSFQFAFPIETRQFSHLPAIDLRRRETQFLFEGLLQNPNVPVLTKYKRHDQPVGPRADLAIRPLITEKGTVFPARHVRSLPTVRA